MRRLFPLILACLVLTAVAAPAAWSHEDGRKGGRGEGRHEGSAGRGHDRDGGPGQDRGRRGEASFFGAPGQADCSRDPWVCSFLFSRSVTEKLLERLTWVMTEHVDYAEKLGARLCRRAQKENECAGSFVAGLWNGVDELGYAVAEGLCATVRLQWSKTDGLSQTWGRTSESCKD